MNEWIHETFEWIPLKKKASSFFLSGFQIEYNQEKNMELHFLKVKLEFPFYCI